MEVFYLSKSDIRVGRLFKFESMGSIYAYAAIFVLMAAFLTSSFYIVIMRAALPEGMAIFFSFLRFIGFFLLMEIFFTKARGVKQEYKIRDLINSLIITISVWVFIIGLHSLFGLISAALSPLLTKLVMDSTFNAFLLTSFYTFLGFVVAGVIASFAVLYYILLLYKKNYKDMMKTYLVIIKALIAKPIFFIKLNVFIMLLLFAGAYLQTGFGALTAVIIPYSFLQIFLQVAFSAAVNMVLLNMLFQTGRILILEKKSPEIIAIKVNNPIPAGLLVAIVPIVVGFVLFPIQSLDAHNRITDEIKQRITTGDILTEAGLTDEAIWEYSAAQSLLEGAKGYYKKIIGNQNGDAKLINEADALFVSSLDLFPANSYVPLFKANLLNNEKDKEAALLAYKKAILVTNFQPDSMVRGYELAVELKDRKSSYQMLDWMIKNEVYSEGFSGYTKMSEKKLSSLINKLEKIEEDLGPKQVYRAYLYAETGIYDKAEAEFSKILENYPKDPKVHYYMSKFYNIRRQEQNNYDKVIRHAEDFVKYYKPKNNDEEIEAKVFLAESYMTVNKPKEAMLTYQDISNKNPENKMLAKKYAYTLIVNKEPQKALDVLQKLVYSEEENITEILYLKAMALLNLAKHEESIAVITELDKYKDQYPIDYDRYLYTYSLAYANSATDDTVLEKARVAEEKLVYPYIMAMKAWAKKDNAASYEYMKKVLAKSDKLGFAFYAQGINAYENAVRNNTNDYKEAIEYYEKAARYLPEHVELYFSMGHAYKKAEKYEDSLKAFRNCVRLLPTQDHRTDYFGITVHAQGEISTLKRLIAEKGGN